MPRLKNLLLVFGLAVAIVLVARLAIAGNCQYQVTDSTQCSNGYFATVATGSGFDGGPVEAPVTYIGFAGHFVDTTNTQMHCYFGTNVVDAGTWSCTKGSDVFTNHGSVPYDAGVARYYPYGLYNLAAPGPFTDSNYFSTPASGILGQMNGDGGQFTVCASFIPLSNNTAGPIVDTGNRATGFELAMTGSGFPEMYVNTQSVVYPSGAAAVVVGVPSAICGGYYGADGGTQLAVVNMDMGPVYSVSINPRFLTSNQTVATIGRLASSSSVDFNGLVFELWIGFDPPTQALMNFQERSVLLGPNGN